MSPFIPKYETRKPRLREAKVTSVECDKKWQNTAAWPQRGSVFAPTVCLPTQPPLVPHSPLQQRALAVNINSIWTDTHGPTCLPKSIPVLPHALVLMAVLAQGPQRDKTLGQSFISTCQGEARLWMIYFLAPAKVHLYAPTHTHTHSCTMLKKSKVH